MKINYTRVKNQIGDHDEELTSPSKLSLQILRYTFF